MRKGSNRLKGNSVIRRFFRESLFTDGSAACNYRRWIFKEKDMGLEEKYLNGKTGFRETGGVRVSEGQRRVPLFPIIYGWRFQGGYFYQP